MEDVGKLDFKVLVMVVFTVSTLLFGTAQFASAGSIDPEPEQEFRLIGHDNDNHNHILIDINSGTATILGSTTFDSLGSGLASSRNPVDTRTSPDDDTVITFPGGTHFGVYRDGSDGKDYVIQVETTGATAGKANKIVEVVGGIAGRGVAFGSDGVTFFCVR